MQYIVITKRYLLDNIMCPVPVYWKNLCCCYDTENVILIDFITHICKYSARKNTVVLLLLFITHAFKIKVSLDLILNPIQ